MNRNFERALKHVLRHEGGFVNHKDDPGGATNKGVTIGTYRRYINRNGTVNDLRNITDEQAARVYRRQYWDKVRGDDLPDGVDYAVFDFAVNSGPGRSAKYLQAIVGVKQDGIIGPITIAAARAMEPTAIITRLCDNRMAFLKRLKHWPTFKNGWTRRVTDVLAEAMDMAATTKPEPPHDTATPPAADRPHGTPAPSGKGGMGAAIAAALVALIAAAVAGWDWLTALF